MRTGASAKNTEWRMRLYVLNWICKLRQNMWREKSEHRARIVYARRAQIEFWSQSVKLTNQQYWYFLCTYIKSANIGSIFNKKNTQASFSVLNMQPKCYVYRFIFFFIGEFFFCFGWRLTSFASFIKCNAKRKQAINGSSSPARWDSE